MSWENVYLIYFSRVMELPNPKGHTSNLWGKCPLYGSNATGRLISQEIHYRPLTHMPSLVICHGFEAHFDEGAKGLEILLAYWRIYGKWDD